MLSLWHFVVRVARRAARADVKVLAGGVALFLLLGLLPAITAVVSVYALVADPSRIELQLAGLGRLLPDPVFNLLVAQLQRAASRSGDELGLALAGSVLVALLSSRSGVDALLRAIHRIDGEPPHWTGWRHHLLTLVLAISAIVGAVTVLATVVALPAIAEALLPRQHQLIAFLRWPALMACGVISLSVLYWMGAPARGRSGRGWRAVVPGALVATVLGALTSWALSYYVTQWASYQTIYGAFAGAIVTILWFYVASLAILIGAAVNAECSRPC